MMLFSEYNGEAETAGQAQAALQRMRRRRRRRHPPTRPLPQAGPAHLAVKAWPWLLLRLHTGPAEGAARRCWCCCAGGRTACTACRDAMAAAVTLSAARSCWGGGQAPERQGRCSWCGGGSGWGGGRLPVTVQ